MESRAVYFCVFLHCVMESVSGCLRGSYQNLCGFNGNEYNASAELNSTEIICDCQTVIYCSVVSFVRECNSTTIHLKISENTTLWSQMTCNISPLEPQALIPTLEVFNSTGNELYVKFFANSHFGMYKVFCLASEISEEINKTSSNEWEIIGVTPREIFVDSEVKLQLKLNKSDDGGIDSLPAHCFVKTPDSDTEILSILDASEDDITCSAFVPVVPGVFRVSLNYELSPYASKKSIEVEVIGKHPVAQRAEYDYELETILIYFDSNIELRSACGDAFPEISREFFGEGFECYTRGNTLVIKMGSGFKVLNNITVNSDNKICRQSYRRSEICLSVRPANLIISKPEVSGPSLSFYTTDDCTSNSAQKYIGVRMLNLNEQNTFPQNQTRTDGAGKTHRKNLIIWRSMRQIQSKLSSRLAVKINNTDFLPLYENLSAFDIDLDSDDHRLGRAASVSVYVQNSFANSHLLAEAHVRFCDDHVKLFRYKWLVNGKNISEEGRLVTLRNRPPGKYLIKCLVVAYDSAEILGQGWATVEVFKNKNDVLIMPSEAAVGEAEDISLRAVTPQGDSVSWTCKTAIGKPCLTRTQNQLSDVYDLTLPNISLPAGSLPVGDYIWTLESSGETKMAKISIKPGEVVVDIEPPAAYVDPSLGIVLNGSIQGAKETCYAGWSSVRQKGFSYLDLQAIGVEEIRVEEYHPKLEIPLVVPPATSGLEPHSLYLFKLQVFCPRSGSLRYMKIPVRTSAPPTVFPITVEPLAGEAMITNFKVSGAEADVSVRDHPLTFEWSYIDPCDTEVLLGRGLSARNFTTYLPPGDVKIMARVCNWKKICSTSVSRTVAVIQPVHIHAENFDETLNQIRYLMATGDAREAFGLAVTIFKSLALTAELEVRQKVFSVVEEVVILRIKYLSGKFPFDAKAVKLSVEFCEQAETVAKYFRKNSAVLMRLRDFRKSFDTYSQSN